MEKERLKKGQRWSSQFTCLSHYASGAHTAIKSVPLCARFSEGRRPACVMFIFGLTFLAFLALLAEKPLIPSQKFPEFSKNGPSLYFRLD